MNYTKIFKTERSTFLAVSKQSDEHGFNWTYNCFEAGNGVVQKTTISEWLASLFTTRDTVFKSIHSRH
jgi:hypothetical protein